MKITPSSDLRLYSNVKINPGENIAFPDANTQAAYFNRHYVAGQAELTYCRPNEPIKVEIPLATVLRCNYMSFRNQSFENITYYALITDVNYINNETTEISYSIDPIQTEMFAGRTKYEETRILRENLSQSAMEKAKANPYRRDILELETPEPALTVSPEQQQYPAPTDAKATTSYDMALYLYLSPIETDRLDHWASFEALFDGGVRKKGFTLNFPVPCWVYKMSATRYSGNTTLTWTDADGESHTVTDTYYNVAIAYLAEQNCMQSVLAAMWLPEWITYTDAPADPGETLPLDDGLTLTASYTPRPTRTPKMMRYPYYYLEVQTPDGQRKEYRWEDFVELTLTDSPGAWKDVHFRLMVPMTPAPTVYLAPWRYRQTLGSLTRYWPENLNMAESTAYSEFPQLAISCDSFLTYLANQYASMNLAGDKYTRNYELSSFYGPMGSMLKGAAGMVSQAGSGLTDGMFSGILGGSSAMKADLGQSLGMAGQFITDSFRVNAANQRLNQRIEAEGMHTAGMHAAIAMRDGSIDTAFGYAKQAFVANEYRQGTSTGQIYYYTSRLQWRVYERKLLDDVAQEYDKYLKRYGYASIRIGKPRVLNYMQGETDGAFLPSWETVDNAKATYIQTADLHVRNPILGFGEAIAQAFNAGIRFFDGGSLQ